MKNSEIHSITCPHCSRPDNYTISTSIYCILKFAWTQLFICSNCNEMFQAEIKRVKIND